MKVFLHGPSLILWSDPFERGGRPGVHVVNQRCCKAFLMVVRHSTRHNAAVLSGFWDLGFCTCQRSLALHSQVLCDPNPMEYPIKAQSQQRLK